jgi:hypothetical protein
MIFIFLGARPGSASGCFKKATQIPKVGHPIFVNYGYAVILYVANLKVKIN